MLLCSTFYKNDTVDIVSYHQLIPILYCYWKKIRVSNSSVYAEIYIHTVDMR